MGAFEISHTGHGFVAVAADSQFLTRLSAHDQKLSRQSPMCVGIERGIAFRWNPDATPPPPWNGEVSE